MITDSPERVAFITAEMCEAHEATHDLIWLGLTRSNESPALAPAVQTFADLVQAAADALIDGAQVRALLDTLTYRAFRVHAGLDVEATRRREQRDPFQLAGFQRRMDAEPTMTSTVLRKRTQTDSGM